MDKIASFFGRLYGWPLRRIIGLIVVVVIVWGLLAVGADKIGKSALWRWLNRGIAVFFVAVILTMTYTSRGTPSATVTWGFLQKWEAARQNKELYREMLMNVLLFVPYGMAMPFALLNPRRKRRNWPAIIVAVWLGIIFSAFIECLQMIYSRGHTEVEDLICNSIGTAVGAGAFLIWIVSAAIRRIKSRSATSSERPSVPQQISYGS